MEIITYKAFRQNQKSFLDKVIKSHTLLFESMSNGENVMVLSKSEYEGMQETFHWLSNPNNSARLIKGIEECNQGIILNKVSS
jgi:antitoxin YefM